MKLNRLALLLPALAALVLVPMDAQAKDRKRDKHKHCDRDDDRRYDYRRSDYGRSDYYRRYDRCDDRRREYYRPQRAYYAPTYYSPYYRTSGGNCAPQRYSRSSGLRLVIGF